MKIVLVGIYYPVAILRYFEAALRRRVDVELVTVGPYTGSWIPWNGGMQVRHIPAQVGQPDIELPRDTVSYFAYVESRLPWEPDLWVQVDAGYHLRGKPRHGAVATIGTDPHVLNYDDVRSDSDVFFCMQKFYSKPGDVWLPYAYDPVWHSKRPDDQVVDLDTALIGIPYASRNEFNTRLTLEGIKSHLSHGQAYDDARQLYWRAKVGWNWSSLKDLTARVFELMAMGLAPVVNRVPDLALFTGNTWREGRDYLGFDTGAEALSQVKFALDGDNWKIIGAAAQKAVEPHTYDARIQSVLETMQK